MTNLIKTLNVCLDILRNEETIIGEKALRNLNYLLILKLLEPQLNNIKIDDYDYDFENIKFYLKFIKFSNLATDKTINSYTDIISELWINILSEHPYTSKIFNKNEQFDIKKHITFKKILLKLHNLNLNDIEYDILGDSYEELVKNIMTGKVLGQFFTQPIIKNIVIKLLTPKLHKNGTIDSFCDPAMGTGGFLISYLRDIHKQSTKKNIKIDWENIDLNLYGQEISFETYQLAISNMLISTGHIFNNLIKGDSIKELSFKEGSIKYIATNPPFGIKGINYKDLNNNLKIKYIPLETNNAVSLFLQIIVYMLKINGKCAIVLPNGSDWYSDKPKFIKIREYLLKTCDLQEIIYLPENLFTNTSIKTCIFYFIKKVSVDSVINNNKIITDIHQTQNIKFYNYNIETETKDFLIDININQIIKNKYNLNYSNYNNIEVVENFYKYLKDICIFLPKSKRPASYGKTNGIYPFYKSSMKLDSYVDECDYKTESIIIGDGGTANINYNTKFSTSNHCYILQLKNNINDIKLKYIYYYLFHNLNILEKGFLGSGLKNISKEYINNIQIPIISLDQQENLIEYYDKLYELDIFVKNKLISLISNKINVDCIKTKIQEINKIKDEINKIL